MIETWTVPALTERIREVLQVGFGGELWVEGEITDLNRNSSGHVYFNLVEPGADRRAVRHSLAVTLFDSNRQKVNLHIRRSGVSMKMADGVRVRVRGSIDLYAPRSTLQLRMTGIDPTFTLGALVADRDRVLATLSAEGLLRTNGAVPMRFLPQRIAVVTSLGSAAHADVMDELTASPIGLDLVVIDSRVQGEDAAGQIVAAIGAGTHAGVDVIIVVRGGGAKTDLVAFDHERVGRAIATCPVPVLVGVGHETDRTVADEVCHASFKTPTACAAAVVAMATEGRDRIEEAWSQFTRASGDCLANAAESHRRAGLRLGAACRGDLARATAALDHANHRMRSGTANRIAGASAAIGRADSVLRAHDPRSALARGWSITRTADGRAVAAADVRSGDMLVTRVFDGIINSTVADAAAAGPTEQPQPRTTP